MPVEFMDRRNLNFVIYELLDAEELTKHDYYADHSRETFDAIIDVAAQIAREKFYPHNATLDANEPVVVDGKVKLLPEVKDALIAYCEAGFLSAHHSMEMGGIQLPRMIALASQVWFSAANVSTTAYVGLTKAAANVIAAFGSEQQQAEFLPPMLDGRCFGTMVLTEPQAGSSLADITTSAEPAAEGHYLIKGNKIFISGGEHELSENIVHLVLARIKGGPAGIKGISLFIVPRYRINPDGTPGAGNDVALAGLIHKMGYRGTTSTMLNFGESGACHGYLIGEPHKGLNYMFHMMNEARINVGMGAIMLGYAGYLYSLDYARNRPQGRLPGNNDPTTGQVMLIEHADVRRMLLMQKAYVEGAFALGFYAACLLDNQKTSPDETLRSEAGLLLEILTPIIKSWSSEYCVAANDQAIQVLGGYGYTREYPVEHYYRNNRLNPIHEGTTAIQGIDLLGRKVSMQNGAAFKLLMREIRATISAAADVESLGEFARLLSQALVTVEETTALLLEKRDEVGLVKFFANATLYLGMMGHTVIAWMWLRQALVAVANLPDAVPADRDFYQGKIQACRFFMRWELPKTQYQSQILKEIDPTCYDMQDSWF